MKNIALLTIFVFSLSHTVYPQWEKCDDASTPLYLSSFTSIGNKLFAGDSWGVCLSTDNGKSWARKDNGWMRYDFWGLIANNNILFAITNEGVFISSNGGEYWNYRYAQCPRTILVYDKFLYVGTFGFGVQKCPIDEAEFDNVRRRWSEMNEGLDVLSISSLGVCGDYMFAGPFWGGGIYRFNKGSRWEKIFLDSNITMVYQIKTVNNTIFAGMLKNYTDKGIYYISADYGENWYKMNCIDSNNQIFILENSGKNIYVGSEYGVYMSKDLGKTWILRNNGLTDFVYELYATGNIIYAKTRQNDFFMTTDQGNNWIQINAGFFDNQINSIITNGSFIFAGTRDGMFVSKDLGNSWERKNEGLSVTEINSLVVNGKDIYVGTFGKVYVSTDNGESWIPRDNGLKATWIYSIISHGNDLLAGSREGVFLSTDKGNNWQSISNGLTNVRINSLAINGQNIFAGTDKGVYLSTDYGKYWSQRNEGLTSSWIYSLAINGNNIFAGSSSGGVYLSTDNGDKWLSVNNGLTELSVRTLLVNGNNLFVGTAGGGVYITTDNGGNWVERNDRLADKDVYSLAAGGEFLYAGTKNGGVFRAKILDLIPEVNSVSYPNALFSLSPNPASDYLEINLGRWTPSVRWSPSDLTIYNSLGECVLTPLAFGDVPGVRLDISALPPGIYFIRIGCENHKFIKY